MYVSHAFQNTIIRRVYVCVYYYYINHKVRRPAMPALGAEWRRVAAKVAESQSVTSTGHAATRCSADTFARGGRALVNNATTAVMLRFINKNIVFGSVEMAAVMARDNGGGSFVEQPVPFDTCRESHHLLTLDGSTGMRSSNLKQETCCGRGSRVRMCVDLLGVSFCCYFCFLCDPDGELCS